MRELDVSELNEVSGGKGNTYFRYGDGVYSPNIVRTKSCNETDSRAAQAKAMKDVDWSFSGTSAGTSQFDAALQGRVEYRAMCGTDKAKTKYDYTKSNFQF